MPTHYRPDAIACAIGSVLDQTEPDFELLVVGDGAAPATAEAVQSFSDQRIRWLDLPKAPGFGYANRNIALRQARGELIAFAADDDLMLPDHLALHGAALANPTKLWSYSQALWVSQDGVAAPDLTNLDFADERRSFSEVGNTICGGSFVYRATALRDRAAWGEDLPGAGDWRIMLQLLAHGTVALARLPTPTLIHFAAARKTGRHSESPLLSRWLDVADHSAWWPAELRFRSDSYPSLQEACLQSMRGDPGFVPGLRKAATDVVSRLALECLDGPTRQLAVQPNAQLEEAHRELAALAAAHAAEISAFRQSTSWRLTAPLRALRQWLKRPRP
jgi:glycosyltransferase involved in cell wall biosynthesis